jgi:hypothetical protein
MDDIVAQDLSRLFDQYEAIVDAHMEAMGVETMLKGAMLNLISLVEVAGEDLSEAGRKSLAFEIVLRVATALELDVRHVPRAGVN